MPPEGERLRVERIEQALLPMARTALDAGQAATARRLYSRLLEVDPDSIGARMGLGDVALADRDPGQAATWYLAALAHAVAPAERHAAMLSHGRAALADADVEAARQSFLRLTDPAENASRSHVAWGFNGTGVILLLQGKPVEAVAAMERAVLLDPGEPRFRANLARAARIAASYPVTPTTRDNAVDGVADAAPGEVHEVVGQPAPSAPSSLEEFAVNPSDPLPPAAPDSEPPVAFPPRTVATGDEPEREVEATRQPETLPPQAPAPHDIDATRALPAGAFYVRTEDGDYVQVGAYAVEGHATETAAALRDTTGLPVRVERALRNGRLLYRVHVGPVPPKGLPEHLAGALGIDAGGVSGGARASTGAPLPEVVVEVGAAYVEAAQFTDYADAEAFARRLRTGTGHPVELAKVSLGGSPSVYRVRVGPLPHVPPELIEEIARIRSSD